MVGHVHPVSCHHGTTQTSVRSAVQTSGREIGEGRRQEFVVVGDNITMYNNPAFQAFLMATVAPYKIEWPSGEDRPLVVSIGTGISPQANTDLEPGEMNLLYNATSIPSALMSAALNEQDLLCRIFGRCFAGDELDREVGDLKNAKGPVVPNKSFTYVRYNAELTPEGLKNLGLPGIRPEHVQQVRQAVARHDRENSRDHGAHTRPRSAQGVE